MASVGPGDDADDEQGGQDEGCPRGDGRNDAGQSQTIDACIGKNTECVSNAARG